MDVFDLQAVLRLDSSAYEKGLDEAKGTAEKKGSLITGGLKTMATMGAAAFAATGAGVVAFTKSAVNAGASFDKAMSQVAATMGVTTDEIQDLNQFAQEMGRQTQFSATDAAEALNYMALAGYDADMSMQMLPNVLNLAAAGNIDLAYASDMVTDAQSALGLTAEQTTEMVDKMAKTSSKSNTSVAQLGEAILTIGATARSVKGGTTELSTLLGVLADNGIKGAEGGTHLRNILLSLQNPTDNARDILDDLGIAVYDADGNMRSMVDIVGDLQKGLGDMDGASRDAAISGIFNKADLASVNALLNTSGERFDELTGYIDDAAGAAQAMADTQLDNLTGDITIMKSAFEGAQIAVSNKLTPSLRKMVQFGTRGISDLTAAFEEGGLEKAMEVFNGLLDEAITAFADKFPDILDTVGTVMGGMVKTIAKNAPKLIKALADVVTDLAGQLIDGIPEFVDSAVELFLSLVEGLTQALPQLIQKLGEAIPQIANSLAEHSGEILSAGIDMFLVLGQALLDAIPGIVKEIPTFIASIGEGLLEGVGHLFSEIDSMFAQKYDVLSDTEHRLIDTIHEERDAIDEIIQKRQEQFDGIDAETQHYSDLLTELESITDENGKIKEGYEKRAEVITGVLSEAYGVEMEIVDGVIQGYSDIRQKVLEAIEAERARALLAADQEAYTEAIKNQKDAFTQLQTAQFDVDKATEELYGTYQELDKALADAQAEEQKYGQVSDETRNRITDLNQDIENQESALGKQQDALTVAKQNYSDYMGVIQQHEGLMAAVAEGDVDKLNEAVYNMTNDIRDSSYATEKDLSRMEKNSKQTMEQMATSFKNGDKTITKEMVQESINRYDKVMDQQRKYKRESPKIVDEAGKLQNEKLKTRFISAVTEAGTWTEKMTAKIRNTRDGMAKASSYMMDGLNSGMDSKWNFVLGKAQSLANAIKSTVNNALDISSPSKVMKWVGQMIDEGLGIGIEQYAPTDEAANMVSDVISSAEDAIDDYGYEDGIAGSYEGNESVIINMTINGAVGQDVEELANIVSDRLTNQLARRRAVYA